MPFFPFLTHLLPEWLTCDFSVKLLAVHRSSQEMKMQHMGISSRNTDVPLKLINGKGGEEVI